MIEYPRYSKLPNDFIFTKIKEFLAEDAPKGDITSSAIFQNEKAEACIEAEEELVFAGRNVLECIFKGSFASIEVFANDGDTIYKGGIIAKIYGNAFSILIRERVLLNMLQRLCGIATLTSKYVAIAQPYNVKILDTRKTTPGLRLFEKYAVACGGGYNHRLNLSSGILINDKHIKSSGSVT
jgi:nicotinate-nucleotide pyrophosphorylase (carboxylating)